MASFGKRNGAGANAGPVVAVVALRSLLPSRVTDREHSQDLTDIVDTELAGSAVSGLHADLEQPR